MLTIRVSTVVSIPACRVGDPGSIPGLGVFLFLLSKNLNKRKNGNFCKHKSIQKLIKKFNHMKFSIDDSYHNASPK